MKKSLIASVTSKVTLPQAKLENAINRTNRLNRDKSQFSDVHLAGYESILWEFVNIPVHGKVEIAFLNGRDKIRFAEIPASTAFLATCIKGENGSYKLAFGMSLS